MTNARSREWERNFDYSPTNIQSNHSKNRVKYKSCRYRQKATRFISLGICQFVCSITIPFSIDCNCFITVRWRDRLWNQNVEEEETEMQILGLRFKIELVE